MSDNQNRPFYREGLRFECVRCSNCCRFEPGYVFLSANDVQRLEEGLGLSRQELFRTYCRDVDISGFPRISLKEKENFDCIFWEEGGCAVYEYRPLQCRSYPFWAAYLQSPSSWERVKASCPGAGRGRLYTEKEIDSWVRARLDEPPLEQKP